MMFLAEPEGEIIGVGDQNQLAAQQDVEHHLVPLLYLGDEDEAKQLQDGYDLFVKNSDRLEEEIAAVETMTDMQLINNKAFIDDLI